MDFFEIKIRSREEFLLIGEFLCDSGIPNHDNMSPQEFYSKYIDYTGSITVLKDYWAGNKIAAKNSLSITEVEKIKQYIKQLC